ncbi:MAG TPA: NPCBM/NEW2 domain-containing protein [Humisphaera sp.]|nr:NPCBM/NEW2 domain-containing protein [Humisphaera sp.]
MSCRALAIFCMIVATTGAVRAGEITKTDDTILDVNVVSFDEGKLKVEPLGKSGADPTTNIPIGEIVRVQFQSNRDPRSPVRTPREAQNEPAPPRPGPAGGQLSSTWQMKLKDGDQISGSLESWSDDRITIEMQQQVRTSLQVPVSRIAEIWRASPDLVRRAKELKVTAKSEDVAYISREQGVVAVAGTARGIESDSLNFIYDGQQRKINLEHLLGVALSPQRQSPATRPSSQPGQPEIVTFHLLNGDRLSGNWTLLKYGLVYGESLWGQTFTLPASYISSAEVRDNRVVYLSDLKPAKVEQTPYFDRIIPWRADKSLDGGPLKLNDGRQYAHGVAVHSRCVLDYELDGQYQQFRARLGFELLPPDAPPGRVTARVLVDGKAQFENPDVSSSEEPRTLIIDLRAANHLTLEIDFGADQDVNDRVVWANARLIRAAADK